MIYGNKHVVFEQVGVDTDVYKWNSSDNKDDNDCINNYSISKIRDNLNQTIIEYLSNDLQSELVATTIQTAKNGNSSTLVSTTDKLFLQAFKEIGYTNGSVVAENDALTTWQYYTSHNTYSDHIKYNSNGVASNWWCRSPNKNDQEYICYCSNSGSNSIVSAITNKYISSCFAW